ncbi:TetR/AcrR family transcriptional regulator [Actinophytocola gossypii]|uniref:TetR/AcrR family transcriptional regulator n=1 Tax=Actinophytocola gossypii TaxID=2812003 RepID=A0ABT2J311_9PSEU|nr:TetR/AcrR family transcriptional regulator [Actinophytocola gossypii]MCT2582231.1 TetR/AcrR family transcriptional regulator [Actinophytocola gossypii]
MGQRQDLLAGAKRCIAEKGYSRTTARDITAASGANLAAIGYHFGSKEALLNAAVVESLEEWGTAIEQARGHSETGEPLARLERFLAGFLAGSVEQRATLVASVQAFAEAEFAPDVRQQLAETYEQSRRSIAAMLLDIDPAAVDEAGRQLGSLVLAVITGTALQWLIEPEATPSASALTAAVRALFTTQT